MLAATSAVLFLATRTLFGIGSRREDGLGQAAGDRGAVTPEGALKGVVRIRPLPKKGHDEEEEKNDPREAREIDIKSLVIPRRRLVWVGALQYERFFVMKDRIVALHPTAGADLSISVLGGSLPKSSATPTRRFARRAGAVDLTKSPNIPLRYQYWISLPPGWQAGHVR